MSARILVVEDEAIIARDIASTLEDLGYEVTGTADSAPAALASIEAARPDLVLMDIRIRGEVDGIAAAEQIRFTHAIPVVFLTSHADETTVQRAKSTGAYGYVLKPFGDRDLRTAIEVAIEKHAIERKLAERERWYSTTLKSLGDAVIATDQNQKITFMNAVAEQVTGWTNGDAVGRDLADVFKLTTAKSGEAIESPLTRAFRHGFAVQLPRDTVLTTPNGQVRDVDESAAPIVDDAGTLVGGVVVFRDVTERRGIEDRLVQNERLAAIGTLSAGMAHEINNPLAYVLANVSFVATALPRLGARIATLPGIDAADATALAAELEALQGVLLDAQEGSRRVHSIVHDLKKFGRVQVTAPTTIELGDVMDTVLRLTDHVVRPHARVRREYGIAPFVLANASELEQVFTNLITNAAQATREGVPNEITIAISADPAGRAVVEVRDRGTGIPAELRSRIFDPFFTTKGIGRGMGLGLSIAHGIVGALGGELTVESTVGIGSTFRVSLPGARAPDVAREPPLVKRRGRVLVIDDEPAIGRSLTRILQADHDVFMVTSAREALVGIQAGETFDLILSDLMMPELTGMEFHVALATLAPELVPRIVFVTGGATREETQQFLDTVENRVLHKPVAPAELRAIVAELVNS